MVITTEHGIIGSAVLFLDIIAIISVLSSNRDIAAKALWITLILLLPVLGVILWFFVGPRASNA